MPIPTSRTHEKGMISVNEELCTGCGSCVEVCKDFSLKIVDNKAVVSNNFLFGCIACGHCMAVCPENAIKISGRALSEDDLFDLSALNSPADYTSLFHLLGRRRSIREFKDQPVPQELTDKILEAARTAPMGLPPSDVHVLVFDSREKLNTFAAEYCKFLNSLKWFVSSWFLFLMRPFFSRATVSVFRDFLRPLIKTYTEAMKRDENLVTYNAPAGMYFYGSPWCDPADPVVAATYAMLASESLGLGNCMLGGIHPFIQSGRKAKQFRKKWGIRYKSKEGVFVIFGYPAVHYTKGIRRSFAAEDIVP
jgi:NAD-dependent dihydropyrimidine dehydrogenase PreA subunit/nitroreductase